jgi:hypothetical protein
MPATKKETTKKKAATKSTAAKTKKTTAKKAPAKKTTATKKAPAKKKTSTKKATGAKKTTRKAPAKKKIAVRKVAPKEEKIEEEVEEKEESEEILPVEQIVPATQDNEEKNDEQEVEKEEDFETFLKEFSEDQAQQEADENIEDPSMIPASQAIEKMTQGREEDDDFGAELEEKTQHEIRYPEDNVSEESDSLSYNDNLGRSVSLYRKIAYFFIFLVVALLVFIFFFSVVKTTIVLIPDQERIQNNVIFDIYDKENGGAGEAAIKGLVRKLELEESKVYPATGTRVIGQEAVGEVTIYNNYSRNQPLVATTRLLSTNDELFRIKNTVNVPAGGSVDVEIYADDPSPEMAIEPTRFTIPGLWAGLQDKIYAESKEATVYQKKTKKRITREDIDNGIRELKQQLLDEAKLELGEAYSDYTEVIYNIDENSIETEVDGEVDEEKDEFEITVRASVVAIAFNGNQALSLAKKKFDTSISDNKELLSFNEDIDYSLNNYDVKQGVATINASFEGKVSLKENSEIIDKNKIVGLKESQLKVYLDTLPGIAGYEIEFYPSFIKKVPKLVDRIIVEIEK